MGVSRTRPYRIGDAIGEASVPGFTLARFERHGALMMRLLAGCGLKKLLGVQMQSLRQSPACCRPRIGHGVDDAWAPAGAFIPELRRQRFVAPELSNTVLSTKY